MTGPKDPPLQRGGGRALMLGGLVLAVAAATVLALGAEDAGLLRLGILAALWAALLGTVTAVRLRREVTVGAARAEEMRTVYRLELDREIAARREHELIVERELREQAERRERDEIAALRGELQSLRETLRTLLGGDMLVERVALRAESTRLLSMPDHARPVPGTQRGAADAAPRSITVTESPTPGAGRDPWELDQRPDPPQRRREPADVPARPAAQSRPYSPPRREAAPASGAPGGGEPDIFTRTASDLAGSLGSADRSWSPAVASGPPPAHRRRADSRRGAPDAPPAPPAPASPPVPTSPTVPAGDAGSGTFRDNDPLGAVSRSSTGTGRHSRPSVPRYGAATPPAPTGPMSTGDARNGDGAHSTGNGGNGTRSYGSHADRRSGAGHRRAPEEPPAPPPSGGRRVDELLAAYGDGAAPRRRRRHAED